VAAIRRGTVFNGTAPGTDTDIFSSDITPAKGSVRSRLTVALTTSSVLNLSATDGTTTHTWGLNASAALQAADIYDFEFGTNPALAYNVQVETDGVIELLLWDDLLELV